MSQTLQDTRLDVVRDILQLRSRTTKQLLWGILFIAPYLAVFGVFLLYPIFKGFYMSLFHWNPVMPSMSTFVGLENYMSLLHSAKFWTSIINTVYFTVLFVPGVVIISLLLALGVNHDIRGKYLFRSIFVVPQIFTMAVAALVFIQLYKPSRGIINYYLSFVMSNPPNWLNSPVFAMPALVIAATWLAVGFNFIVFLAARQQIPDRLYEASELDGASKWRQLKDITLPQMVPSIVFVAITNTINGITLFAFNLPYIMTRGGPGRSTVTTVFLLYNQAFVSHNLGRAAAIGVALFVLILMISAVDYFLIQRYISEGGDF